MYLKIVTILAISCQTAVLQNNSQCLLLNKVTNATRDIVQFVVGNTNKKMNKQESKERKFEEQVREKECVVLLFIQLYLYFC